ncbi:hypothetical protein [Burkholderia territorii]|uniref:hypothetical protein n=1 Tax=Burkholderia territorii TaxID=1503055 RepID=UPI000AB40DFA|nr:hypothetical protein [Burkholderia territorii]
MPKFILIGRLTENMQCPARGQLPPVTTGSCQPQAATRVSKDRLGSNLGVAKSCNEVGEAIRLQPVPEYLSQSCGKSIEVAQIQAGVLNEQRATDGLERLGQVVPYC